VAAPDDMSITPRRGDAGETIAAGDPELALAGRSSRRPRRFSEGIERKPPPPADLRVGRYSDGCERSPRRPATRRVGNFADGIAHHPDASWERRIGSFADGFQWLGTRAGSRQAGSE
jgi:hypothetical protein